MADIDAAGSISRKWSLSLYRYMESPILKYLCVKTKWESVLETEEVFLLAMNFMARDQSSWEMLVHKNVTPRCTTDSQHLDNCSRNKQYLLCHRK
ncbi:hypothetical protein Y1Q_0006470 [Alligator mississippiensis]|uniref:Uncharacterized protein n=1 Tax=Alligator mississippiensis TaxID=8496 RepID=A0A151MVN2_ALLMI|nr:hypothetical protein Y1Q_0006470 [Alligator mississippiensis]